MEFGYSRRSWGSFTFTDNRAVGQADYDYYRFHAGAGETIVFDVLASRNGANTDAVLSLLNEAGEEIGYSDDYYGFKDPHLAYRFEKEGIY